MTVDVIEKKTFWDALLERLQSSQHTAHLGMALVIGSLTGLGAVIFIRLIDLVQRVMFEGGGDLFAWLGRGLVILVPALGGLLIGLLARYGSEEIRGHGIPEALEAILIGRSRMSPKVAVLKPLSSAVSIGTGGPFGAADAADGVRDGDRTCGGRGLRHGGGALDVNSIESLRAAACKDADQVDDDARAAGRGLHRRRIAQVGLHGVDLADLAERLQVSRQFGPAHADADAITPLGQRADDMPPQKTRAAEHGDERFRIRGQIGGHGITSTGQRAPMQQRRGCFGRCIADLRRALQFSAKRIGRHRACAAGLCGKPRFAV